MIEIYADGSAKANGNENNTGGWGVVVMENNSILESFHEDCINTTNNREELKAVIKALELANTKYKDKECIIYSDSAYVVNICNDWIFTWALNDWKNSRNIIIDNLDLVQILYDYFNTNFLICQVKKCSGHSNILGNELADALARGDIKKIKNLKKLI